MKRQRLANRGLNHGGSPTSSRCLEPLHEPRLLRDFDCPRIAEQRDAELERIAIAAGDVDSSIGGYGAPR